MFGLAASKDGPAFAKVVEQGPQSAAAHLKIILSSETLTKGTSLAWFDYEAANLEGKLQPVSSFVESLERESVLSTSVWQDVWRHATRQRGGDLRNDWIPETVQFLSPFQFPYPDVSFVPAIRRIAKGASNSNQEDEHDLGGTGLIDRQTTPRSRSLFLCVALIET